MGKMYDPKDMIGLSEMMRCNQKCTIVNWRGVADIDVKFEDNSMRENVSYYSFLEGRIAPLDYKGNYGKGSRIGEIRKQRYDKKAKCIEYRDSTCISVEFEDGTVVKGRSWYDFNRGAICHPSDRKVGRHNFYLKRIGEKVRQRDGNIAECIEYNEANNITVRFENGVEVKNKRWSYFHRGLIKMPPDCFGLNITNQDYLNILSGIFGSTYILDEYKGVDNKTLESAISDLKKLNDDMCLSEFRMTLAEYDNVVIARALGELRKINNLE